MRIDRFEDIEGWQLARELAKRVYGVAAKGAFSRDFGLKDQIQRAVGSIMHNIAEGFDGGTNVEFVKFLRYAKRSCTEVQSELYIALDQEYVSPAQFDELYKMASNVKARIGGFIKYLQEFERKKKTLPKT